jgi:DNA-binding NarL/FixJ family response regulator
VTAYRVVLADDHVLFRQGLKSILDRKRGIEIVGEAGDGLKLLALLRKVETDMVILDVSMPQLRGIEATREIKKVSPDIRVLILSMHRDKGYVQSAMEAGAEGYLLKADADTELFAAIERIREHGHYLSPLLCEQLAYGMFQTGPRGQELSDDEPLSNREREVLKLVAEGFLNREIADLLFISVRTVENHRANTMRKLNAKNTADLTKYAIAKGYTSSSENER